MDELFASGRIYTLMLVFSRAGGLLALAPAFTGQSVPVVVRVAMSFLLACILAGLVPSPGPAPAHFLLIVLAIAHEIMVGLLMGMASRLVMFAVEMAGQMMATEIGLMMSSSLDPISHSETSPVSIALSTFAVVIFLISGAHHLMIFAFVRSFELVPAAIGNFDPRVADLVVRESGKIFLLAVAMVSSFDCDQFRRPSRSGDPGQGGAVHQCVFLLSISHPDPRRVDDVRDDHTD